MEKYLAVAGALADANRARILLALRQGELCACQLTGLLELAPSTVSKHCAILRQAGLVLHRKAGRWMHYRLAGTDAAPQVRRALAWLEDALGQSKVARQDRRTLQICCTEHSFVSCPTTQRGQAGKR